MKRLPVKIAKPIKRGLLIKASTMIKGLVVSLPVKMGQVVGNVCGVDVLACCSVDAIE